MIYDNKETFSDAQALTASAASTSSKDFGKDRNIGIGDPMAVLITVGVALGGTSPTFKGGIQMDDNSGFTSATTVIESQTYSALAVNAQVVIPVPPDTSAERYMRLYYTLGGTSPTVTVTAVLLPQREITAYVKYAAGSSVGS